MPHIFDDYTVITHKSFEEAVASVQTKARAKGFELLYVHDVQANLAKEGFDHSPLKIIEICNAEFGSSILEADIQMSLMMPCKISVYIQEGRTYISALRPRILGQLLPSLKKLIDEEDQLMRKIVEEAKD